MPLINFNKNDDLHGLKTKFGIKQFNLNGYKQIGHNKWKATID